MKKTKNSDQETLRTELNRLFMAWQNYLKIHFNEFAFSFKKMSFLRTVSFLALVALFVGVFKKNTVYAQSDLALQPSALGGSLPHIFSWIISGGLISIFVSAVRKKYTLFKRWFDFIVSLFGLIILSPLFLILALLIKMDSYGPIFFQQERVGEKGKLFKIWKFRTMRINAELETGPVWAQDNDPRITRLGNFLRKSHLDELPQLFNMLRGDMSLVGPRPERPELLGMITKHVPDFTERLDVKPGVTGLAQVRYQYGASIKDAAVKLKYDKFYGGKMSLPLDFQIVLWTMSKVITGEGAR